MLSFPSSLSINNAYKLPKWHSGDTQRLTMAGIDSPTFEYKLKNYGVTSHHTLKYNSINLVSTDAKYVQKFAYNTDPFKLPSQVLTSINNYRMLFKDAVSINASIAKAENSLDVTTFNVPGVPSLFNPLLAVNVKGITWNRPIVHTFDPKTNKVTTVKNHDDGSNVNVDVANISFTSTSGDCSAERLCALSEGNTLQDENGNPINMLYRSAYKMTDFIYCRDYGIVPNNQMITLRKFAHPVGDNIKYEMDENGMTGDVGRLICWLGEDNKLEDILKYEYAATWREMNAEIERQNSKEDDAAGGIIGSVVNMMNPAYNKGVLAGKWGAGNHVYSWISQHVGYKNINLFDNQTNRNSDIVGFVDKNKVYEPQDTVQDTHLYEGKLKFNQEFTLVFSYKLRAYDNINPKTAMLDLISNILQTTYRSGRFWGGAHEIMGAPRNGQGWKTANNFIDQAWGKMGNFFEAMMCGNINFGELLTSLGNSLKGIVSDAEDAAKKVVEGGAQEAAKKTYEHLKKFNDNTGFSDALKGMLKNQLGRPAMYAFNSLLSGEPCGFWHVTIGNPLNPIISMGNLIIDKCVLQHVGPLGIDDFPTELKLSITLKHGRSRDATEISKMYSEGVQALSMSLGAATDISKYYKLDYGQQNILGVSEAKQVGFMMSGTIGNTAPQ